MYMRLEAVQCYDVLQHHCLSGFVTAQEHGLNWLYVLLVPLIGICCLQVYICMQLDLFISLCVCNFIYKKGLMGAANFLFIFGIQL